MRDTVYRFLDDSRVEELYQLMDWFVNDVPTAEEFIHDLKELLPIDKFDHDAAYIRVEGFYLVSDLLFCNVRIEYRDRIGEIISRDMIVKEAQLRPFSYYHWMTGSREPIANLMTRDDFFNDPSTALIKLEEDIKALANLYLQSRLSETVEIGSNGGGQAGR